MMNPFLILKKESSLKINVKKSSNVIHLVTKLRKNIKTKLVIYSR